MQSSLCSHTRSIQLDFRLLWLCPTCSNYRPHCTALVHQDKRPQEPPPDPPCFKPSYLGSCSRWGAPHVPHVLYANQSVPGLTTDFVAAITIESPASGCWPRWRNAQLNSVSKCEHLLWLILSAYLMNNPWPKSRLLSVIICATFSLDVLDAIILLYICMYARTV